MGMELAKIGFCGVDCAACPDYRNEKCPGCRESVWPEGDACPPVACCGEKTISCCGLCPDFPCKMMRDFYGESDSHEEAYRRMCLLRKEGSAPRFAPITAEDDAALAQIVRHNLETHDLALPGTAYYDEQLDHLSGYYLSDPAKRFYLVLRDGEGRTLGGVGVAELPFFERCGELQKLYLADESKGAGLGYELIARIEDKARELGYRRIYLETHSNLRAAIHVYEKSGYRLIPRPKEAVHGTMDRFYIKEL